MSANSMPTAPAPITTSEAGFVSFLSAPVEEITAFSSLVTPGSDRGSRAGAGGGAGGEDDGAARLQALRALLARHLDQVASLEDAPAPQQGDLVLAEEELDPLGHAVRHPARALDRLGVVGLPLAHRDPELGRAPEEAHHLGAPEQGLGGNAPPVEAHAPRTVILDRGDREAELGAADGGDAAAV